MEWLRGEITTKQARKKWKKSSDSATMWRLATCLRAGYDNLFVLREKFPANLPAIPDPQETPVFDGSIDSTLYLVRNDGEDIREVRHRVVELLRGEPSVEGVVREYNLRRKKQVFASLDVCAAAAGVSTSQVIGAVTRVIHQYNFEVGRAIVTAVCARSAPAVAEAMVKNAKRPSGLADRKMVLERLDETKPSGQVINVNAEARANSAAVNQQKTEQSNFSRLPTFEEQARELAAGVRSLRQIETAP
jgi:multidrug efflux pump subunit AcrB